MISNLDPASQQFLNGLNNISTRMTDAQRRITTGALLVGGLRAIEKGLNADDRVVLTTTGRAVPGAKVVPKLTTITAPSSAPSTK